MQRVLSYLRMKLICVLSIPRFLCASCVAYLLARHSMTACELSLNVEIYEIYLC